MEHALNRFLDDLSITDLCLNGPDCLFIDRGEGMKRVMDWPGFVDEAAYRRFILEQLSLIGRSWDSKHPFVDGVFFGTHRAHVVFPPLSSSGTLLSLRRLPVPELAGAGHSMAESRWARDSEAFGVLRRATLARETILLAGSTGSGKTTLLSDLITFIPETERLIALEDTAEIRPGHPHWVSLLSRPHNSDGFGAVSIRELLRQALRMRPDRILLGECRGEEVLDLLQALNSGHRGTLATLHANSAKEALKRIELLALLASRTGVAPQWIRELMVQGIQWVAHLESLSGHRRIRSVIRIEGLERETVISRPVYSAPP